MMHKKINNYTSIEEAVSSEFGRDVKIIKKSYVGGGDINEASCLHLSNDTRVFLKSNSYENRSFFDAEVAGLNAIASTFQIRTPLLICKGADKTKHLSFLMMEMIDSKRYADDCWEVFASDLANMHSADTTDFVPDKKFGFVSDNYIGASHQVNSPRDTWVEFFRECRIEPQLKMAGKCDRTFLKNCISLLDKLEDLLPEPTCPSLLHGDMWSGNIMIDETGHAMLIDPAVYVGHAEADIAMTELFGRLPSSFYSAYREYGLIQEGYEDRKELYNLYHMLNHYNLFGASYLGSCVRIVKKYI